MKRKTDKDDALKLERLAAMGELKPVHTPSPEHREFRSLVKYRKTLDGRINKTASKHEFPGSPAILTDTIDQGEDLPKRVSTETS